MAMNLQKQLLAAGACIGVVSRYACCEPDWALRRSYLRLLQPEGSANFDFNCLLDGLR